MKRFVIAGVIAGIGGGLALALLLLLIGEGPIDAAIAIEDAAAGDTADPLFSRVEQRIGGVLGSIVIGAAFGAIFGVVFAAVRHRLPGGDDWRRAWWLGAIAFITVQLIPAIKYPANPPAVGDPETVEERTIYYLLFMAFCVLSMIVATSVARMLRERGLVDLVAATTGTVLFIAMIAAGLALFPANTDPVEVPAQLVWEFRIASIGAVLGFWAVTATLFGWWVRTDLRLATAKRPEEALR